MTDAEDARQAVKCGADFLGMIMWPKAKRYVSPMVAREIVAVASKKDDQGFPKVVGVFVDENAEQIENIRHQTKIDMVQLHGDASKHALPFLDPNLPKIYVLHANSDGNQNSLIPRINQIIQVRLKDVGNHCQLQWTTF